MQFSKGMGELGVWWCMSVETVFYCSYHYGDADGLLLKETKK